MKAYIARDKYGFLFLYREKPDKRWDLLWREDLYGEVEMPDDLFPEVTWENSPVEVELFIQKKK